MKFYSFFLQGTKEKCLTSVFTQTMSSTNPFKVMSLLTNSTVITDMWCVDVHSNTNLYLIRT